MPESNTSLDHFRRIDITLDSAQDYIIIDSPVLKTGDVLGRTIHLRLTDGGQPVDGSAFTVNLGWTHPLSRTSGMEAMQTVDGKGGIFELNIPKAMTAHKGAVVAAFQIVANEKITTSQNFTFEVIQSPFDETTGVQVASLTPLERALIQLNNIQGRVLWLENSWGEVQDILRMQLARLDVEVSSRASQETAAQIQSKLNEVAKDAKSAYELAAELKRRGTVKSIQRGSIQWPMYAKTCSISFSSVATGNSVITVEKIPIYTYSGSDDLYTPYVASFGSTSATLEVAKKPDNSGVEGSYRHAYWTVIEFY